MVFIGTLKKFLIKKSNILEICGWKQGQSIELNDGKLFKEYEGQSYQYNICCLMASILPPLRIIRNIRYIILKYINTMLKKRYINVKEIFVLWLLKPTKFKPNEDLFIYRFIVFLRHYLCANFNIGFGKRQQERTNSWRQC